MVEKLFSSISSQSTMQLLGHRIGFRHGVLCVMMSALWVLGVVSIGLFHSQASDDEFSSGAGGVSAFDEAQSNTAKLHKLRQQIEAETLRETDLRGRIREQEAKELGLSGKTQRLREQLKTVEELAQENGVPAAGAVATAPLLLPSSSSYSPLDQQQQTPPSSLSLSSRQTKPPGKNNATATPPSFPPVVPEALVVEPIPDTALVIFTYNRPKYLQRTLESVLGRLPKTGYTVYISQDGEDPRVRAVAESYADLAEHLTFHYVKPQRANQFPSSQGHYFKIAMHYGFALSKLFDEYKYKRVLLVEDDMELAPDFFAYFEAMAPLVEADESLLCVSAWNDNGLADLVSDPRAFYRGDVFPGLGWLLTERIWAELGWTNGFWDDWMREPAQVCVCLCVCV
jgi:hypothetical protein